MQVKNGVESDSQRNGGGVPDLPGVPAFSLIGQEPSAIPVLIAVPHAGRAYSDALIARMRDPAFAALRLEDRHADLLGGDIARVTGALLLVAHAPRALIDLNRAPDDIDWGMFDLRSGEGGSPKPGGRARTGLGLIPRRLPGAGELWRGRHQPAELTRRIDSVHEPYHACLAKALETIRQRWGAALLVDLHSMPPLPPRAWKASSQLVVGDRFGASCDGGLVASAFSYLKENRCEAAHNRPYAGGYVLERHGRPRAGIHALQLEVDRSAYLDSRLAEPGEGLAAMGDLLAGLVARLATEVAALGAAARAIDWPEAAE